MRRHGRLFLVQPRLFFLQSDHRRELIRPDLVERDSDAQLQRRPEIDCAAQQQAKLRCLRRIEFVQRAVAAAAAIVGCIGAEPWVAELLAAQRPVDQESQGRLFGPLPGTQFGSESSSKAASSASMAAFTATAWWMIGTSPA